MRYKFLAPDSELWRQMLALVRCDVYHLPQYCALEAEYSGGTPVAFYAEDGRNRFLQPMILSKVPYGGGQYRDAVTPYGYPGPLLAASGPDGEAFLSTVLTNMKQALWGEGVIALFAKLNPFMEMPFGPLEEQGILVLQGDTLSFDLTVPEPEIWRDIAYNYRRAIVKERDAGTTAFMDENWQYFPDFEKLYTESMDRLNAAAYYRFPRRYLERLKEILGDRLQLCVVQMDGEISAAGLCTEMGGIVQGYLCGTKTKYIRRSPTLLMYDHVRRWAKERGNRYYHMGSGIGGKRDSLYEYKARLCNCHHPYYTWRLIVNEPIYRTATHRWQQGTGLMADPDTGYFPAYRKPVGDQGNGGTKCQDLAT